MQTIHNCHTHIFTAECVPENVLPLGAVKWLQNESSAKRLRGVLRAIDPIASFIYRNFAGGALATEGDHGA